MEQKLVRVPFDIELAKKITNGDCKGGIVTRNGRNVRIVCFDAHCDDNIVALIEDEKGVEYLRSYVSDGVTFLTGECDCDLMLEIPEYMTFKDGDVIAYDNIKDVFFIIRSKCSITDENPHYYVKYEKGYLTFGTEDSFCRLKGSRLATEEEKQKIIEALKASKESKAKEYLKRFFPNYSNSLNIGKNYEFKPFDKVICRDDYSEWFVDMFSHIDKNGLYACIGQVWNHCIPYNDQTAHLLGTTEDWEK